MSASKITWVNKIDGDQVTAADVQQIKDVSVNHADLLDSLESSKLDASAFNDRFVGKYTTLGALNTARPTGADGQYAHVDSGGGSNAQEYIWDAQAGWVLATTSTVTSTDSVAEGSTNLYFTENRVRAAVLTAISFVSAVAVVATDNILVAIGKLQAQVNNLLTTKKTKAIVVTGTTAYSAILDEEYNVTNGIGTFDDPIIFLVDGKYYTVNVLGGGTAIVGGITYSIVGTVIKRVRVAGAWVNEVYLNKVATPTPVSTAIVAGDGLQEIANKAQTRLSAAESNLAVVNANSARRRGKFANFNIVGFPSRGNQQSASNYSDGVITTETSKVYAKNIGNTTELALYFTNFAYIGRTTATTQADYTIEASIEYPVGTITRVTFHNGSNTFLLKKGFGVLSDFIKIYIPPNTPYAIRTNVLVNSGETWLRINYAYNSSVLGTEVVMQGVNLVAGGAMTGTANPFVYSPTAIIGLSNTRKASILLKGDSRSQGTGDSGAGAVDYGDHTLRGGLFGRALEDKFPILNCGLAGQKISHWAKGSSNQSIYYDEMLSMCQFCLTNLGINDLISGSTAAQVQAFLILSWDSDLSHGLKTYQTTLEPVTTSTDGWVTEANQTVISWNAEREFVNAWLRDNAPIDKDTRTAVAVGVFNSQTVRVGDYRHPLKGIFDTAILVESTTTPGKWRAGFSIDGTHHTATGYAAGYPAIDTTVFSV